MSKKLSILLKWLNLVGCVSILVGLGWDAYLHSQDHNLAANEGIFTLSNPGHLLLVSGIGLVVMGSVVFLLGKASQKRADTDLSPARLLYSLGAVAVLALAIGSGVLAMQSDGGLLDDHHDHGSVASASTVPTVTAGTGSGTAATPGHSHGGTTGTPSATAPVTPEQQAAADKLVSDTKSDIARFTDYNTAMTEGYKQITPYVLGRGSDKYGPAHFYNAAYNRDSKLLDPTKPEALVYFKMPGGQMILLGAMYLAPTGQGPTPGGSLTTWHTHDNLCASMSGVALKNSQGNCPAGSLDVGSKAEMLHVWTFNNPDGPFAHNLTAADYKAALKELAGASF